MTAAQRIERRGFPILATLALVALAYGFGLDLSARFSEALSSDALPKSFLVLIALGVAALALAVLQLWLPQWFVPLQRLRARLGRLRWVLALLPPLLLSYLLLYTKWSTVIYGPYLRGLFFLTAMAISAWLATSNPARAFQWTGLLAAGVLVGSIFSLSYAFQDVVAYPFSLSWSEGNRLWDYSVMYGQRLYNYPADRALSSLTNDTRISLWGLPFLFADASIRFMRLWDAILFTLPYMLLGGMLFYSRRERLGVWFLLILWTYLFINQGPIYAPLVLAAILVAAAVRLPLIPGMLLLALAGYYARDGRYTWMFAPGIWAFTWALVEAEPLQLSPAAGLVARIRTLFGHYRDAFLLGAAGLVGGYVIPEVIRPIIRSLQGHTVNPSVISVAGLTTTVGRQPLLWDRLWPNSTYHLGIVFGLLLATGPLAALLIYFAVSRRWRLDIWQKMWLVASLGVFLAVGLVVSVKIGGGSNLHNVDMFLIGVLFAVALAWRSGLREWALAPGRGWLLALLVLASVLYPASQNTLIARQRILPDSDQIDDALTNVRKAVTSASKKGEVLFMDQRQLLTFGYVNRVPLTPEYEKKLVMDQAMAENAEYFDQFYQDLAAHRFKLIVSEPLQVRYQGDSYLFGNENDAWVKWVSVPLLCYYEPFETQPKVGVQLLRPKQKEPPKEGLECPPY